MPSKGPSGQDKDELATEDDELTCLRKEAISNVRHHGERFRRNIDSVGRLLKLAPISPAHDADILRAIVVFTHSAMEDALRQILREVRLELGNFSGVPLRVLSAKGGDKSLDKFTLEELAQHKGKSVADVLKESLDLHLNQRPFNNARDLGAFLKETDLREFAKKCEKKVDADFGLLEQMILRRHQIVHQADVPRGASAAAEINKREVESWVTAASEFLVAVISLLAVRSVGVEPSAD